VNFWHLYHGFKISRAMKTIYGEACLLLLLQLLLNQCRVSIIDTTGFVG
jgi:hypothetical protein